MRRLVQGAIGALLVVGVGGRAHAQAATDGQKVAHQSSGVSAQQSAGKAPTPQPRTPAESAIVALRSQMQKDFTRKVRNQLGLNQPTMKRLVDMDQKYEQQRRTLGQQLSKVTQDLRQSILHDPDTPEFESKDSALEMQRHHLLGQRDDIDSIERVEVQTFLQPRQWILFFGLKEQFDAELEAATGQRMLTTPPPLLPAPRRGGGGKSGQTLLVKPDTGRSPSAPPPTP